MGMDNLQSNQVLFLHCYITCIYFAGICLYLCIIDKFLSIGTYKIVSMLSMVAFLEPLKIFFTWELNNYFVEKMKPTILTKLKKNIIKFGQEILKFVMAIVLSTIIYYIVIVLYGAPLLTHIEETLILSITLTNLTLTPASFHLGIDNAIALFSGSQLLIGGMFVEAVKLNIKAVLLSTWLSAFVLPLDWDQPWQAWPIPCVIGALVGYFVGHFITLVKVSITKFKKKSKRNEPFKNC